MKKTLSALLALVMVLSLFAGCDQTDPTPSTNTPTVNTPTQPAQPSQPTQPTEPADPWAEYETITIAEALTLCESFVESPSTDRYYIVATIDSVDNETHGQLTISDETGSIMVYGSYNADGSAKYGTLTDKPKAGDKVLLYGNLQNYKGNTKEVYSGWIIDWIANDTPVEPSELPADGSELTIAEILALPVADGVTTTQHYIVKATVESISDANFGAMWITDGTGSISVYNSKNADGTVDYINMEDKPFKGDSVTLKCTVQNFKGEMEIKQAYILEFKHAEVSIDPAEYPETSISAIRDAAEGTKATVTGVIAQMVYDSKNNACGFILVDSTSSIYVYDGDLAARVAKGNTVTVAASKTYWVNGTEQSAAGQYGYKGCSQLADAVLLELDSSVKDFDTSWIEEITISDLMNMDVSQDITTKIFKVTALISRDDNYGNWVNYYLNDLDGKTGSYCYSQCDGKDYAWLDAYDGKICTMYMMALNAKCASTGCFWRFLPVAVISDEFDPSSINIPEFIVNAYGLTQFAHTYTGNPALNLVTAVDSDLLAVTGAVLSYQSSDSSVISVENGVMNCLKSGEATITVTGSYGGKTYSASVTVTVELADINEEYPSVSDAINAEVGQTVTLSGIVGPATPNKSTGFYLIDETGVIAVLMDNADILAELKQGEYVVLTGLRDRFFDASKGDGLQAGQTCVTGATVVHNFYGEHEYSTASFLSGKTVTELYNMDHTVDYSTSVYTLTATVTKGSGQWATFYISDGTTQLQLYSGNTSQYAFLEEFVGQEVTVEVALCNWNNKTYWRGCVLSVTRPDGTKVLNDCNFK